MVGSIKLAMKEISVRNDEINKIFNFRSDTIDGALNTGNIEIIPLTDKPVTDGSTNLYQRRFNVNYQHLLGPDAGPFIVYKKLVLQNVEGVINHGTVTTTSPRDHNMLMIPNHTAASGDITYDCFFCGTGDIISDQVMTIISQKVEVPPGTDFDVAIPGTSASECNFGSYALRQVKDDGIFVYDVIAAFIEA